MLGKGTIPPCEKAPILFTDSSYPLHPFIMTEFSSGGHIQEKRSSATNGLVHVSE